MEKGAEDLRTGHAAEAVVAFRLVVAESPRFAEGYLDLGLALSRTGDDEASRAALERGLALKPAMRGAHLFLAIADYRLGGIDAAADAVRKETATAGTDAQAWMWQGIIDLAQGKLTTAVDALDRAAALDPHNVDILYHRGRAALALSRESYEEMFKVDPKSWHVHQVLAEADVEAGKDADAVDEFKLAIAAAPAPGGLYEALGSSLWRTGKYPEAEEAYAQALALDPHDVIAMYKLGCLRVDRSNAAAGKPLLEKVLAADPSLKMTSYYLGRAELQLGNDRAAITDFERTIRSDPDPETTKQSYFQMARAYRRLKDLPASDRAQAEYRQLDQADKTALEERYSRRQARADRDTSLPAPQPSAAETAPN